MEIRSEKLMEKYVREVVERLITETVEEEIEKKIEEFRVELTYRKDKYIREIMEGIKIMQESNIDSRTFNYKITFENIVKLERDGE